MLRRMINKALREGCFSFGPCKPSPVLRTREILNTVTNWVQIHIAALTNPLLTATPFVPKS